MTISYLIQNGLTVSDSGPKLSGFVVPDLSALPGPVGQYYLGNGGFGVDEQLRNIANYGASNNLARVGALPLTTEFTAALSLNARFDTGIAEADAMTIGIIAMPTRTTTNSVVLGADGNGTWQKNLIVDFNSNVFRCGGLDGASTFRQAGRSVDSVDTSKLLVAVGSIDADRISAGFRLGGIYQESLSGAFTGRTPSGTINIGTPYTDFAHPSTVAAVAIFNGRLDATQRATLALALEQGLDVWGVPHN